MIDAFCKFIRDSCTTARRVSIHNFLSSSLISFSPLYGQFPRANEQTIEVVGHMPAYWMKSIISLSSNEVRVLSLPDKRTGVRCPEARVENGTNNAIFREKK